MAELSLIDRDESAEMSRWATDPNGRAPPTPDVERRVGLMKRIEAAEAQARSAAGAMAGPRNAMNAAGQRAAAAQRAAWVASKLIAVEEAESCLGPLKSAIAQVYDAKRKIDSAREGILAGLSPGEDTREVFIALSAFDHKRREAESVPMDRLRPPGDVAPDGQHELARALAQLGPIGPAWDVGAPPQDSSRWVNPSRMGGPL